MKLGADQTGLLLAEATKHAPSECLIVGEVFVTLYGGEDMLFARVVGCRGYDRLYRECDGFWFILGISIGEMLMPSNEREPDLWDGKPCYKEHMVPIEKLYVCGGPRPAKMLCEGCGAKTPHPWHDGECDRNPERGCPGCVEHKGG